MSKAIGVREDGEVVWHVPGVVQDYDTLCGTDADDPELGHQGTVKPKRGQKITCVQCKAIWQATMALKIRATDFDCDDVDW